MNYIKQLRDLIYAYGIDAYIIPSSDEWRNEYTPLHKRRLGFISEFSGSNGVLIVTIDRLFFFTDGRYLVQAKLELSSDYMVLDMHNIDSCSILENMAGLKIGYDPMLQTTKEIQYYEKFDIQMEAIDENLVDKIIGNVLIVEGSKGHFMALIDTQQVGSMSIELNGNKCVIREMDAMSQHYMISLIHAAQALAREYRATVIIAAFQEDLCDLYFSQGFIKIGNELAFEVLDTTLETSHISVVNKIPLEISGMSTDEKITLVINNLQKDIDKLILMDLSAICWLLNIRGNDIPYNPLVLSYVILDIKTRQIQLYINTSKSLELSNVVEYPLKELQNHLLNTKYLTFAISKPPVWFVNNLPRIVEIPDPIAILKACKNPVELHGIRQAHIQDGVAVCKFWYWLFKSIERGEQMDEISVSKQLRKFRSHNKDYVSDSFHVIAGYGSNAAIIHYQPNIKTNLIIQKGNLLLIDSGGQYKCGGTTDITRVFNIESTNDIHKKPYTAVLRGHIALARAKFPSGTTGAQLDVLARYYLWQQGCDYKHGTGHGVGHYLSVHEGPHAISNRNNVPLQRDMIVSIEPGYYEEGKFGIRIENLYAIKDSAISGGFLEFELLTMVPIDISLVDLSIMGIEEINWLKQHNNKVFNVIKEFLSDDESDFLKNLHL